MIAVLARCPTSGEPSRRMPTRSTHHMDPGFEAIRTEVNVKLGQDRYAPALKSDVASVAGEPPSLAQQLDVQKYPGMVPVTSYVARTIFWHTLAYGDSATGITAEQLKLSICSPVLEPSFISNRPEFSLWPIQPSWMTGRARHFGSWQSRTPMIIHSGWNAIPATPNTSRRRRSPGFKAITSVQDRAIFRVGYHRGLRASEVGMLQMSDYRAGAGRLYVHRLEKKDTAESTSLPTQKRKRWKVWLKERGDKPGPIFVSNRGTAISQQMLDVLTKRYCASARIPKKTKPTSTRCGTHVRPACWSAVKTSRSFRTTSVMPTSPTLRSTKITNKRPRPNRSADETMAVGVEI